jgi:hypothetical protein
VNEIATRRAVDLPPPMAEPPLSRGMVNALFCAGCGSLMQPLPAALLAEARALDAQYARLCAPASGSVVARWLFEINAAVSLPIVPESFRNRAPAIAEAVGHLPAALFTAETRNAAALVWKFFPGAAEVAEFLGARAAALHATRRNVAAVLAHGRTEPTEEVPKTQAEIAAVTARIRSAVVAALPPERSVEDQLAALRAPVRSRYLSADQVAMARQAAGIQADASRAE